MKKSYLGEFNKAMVNTNNALFETSPKLYYGDVSKIFISVSRSLNFYHQITSIINSK